MTQTTCRPLRGDRGTEKYNPKEKRKKEGNESASWPPAGLKPIQYVYHVYRRIQNHIENGFGA
jgi:hypothetical protein